MQSNTSTARAGRGPFREETDIRYVPGPAHFYEAHHSSMKGRTKLTKAIGHHDIMITGPIDIFDLRKKKRRNLRSNNNRIMQ